MSQSVIRFDKPALSNVWKADDDWTGLKGKEDRKRRQNRLNQRAYRLRNTPKEPSTKQKPFRIERFRIAEVTPDTTQKDEREAVETTETTITNPVACDPGSSLPIHRQWERVPTIDHAPPNSHDVVPYTYPSVSQEVLALIALDISNPNSFYLSSASATYLRYLQLSRRTQSLQAEPPEAALAILDISKLKEEDPFVLLNSRLTGNAFDCESPPARFSVAASASQALSFLNDALMSRASFPLSSDHKLLHLIHFNVFRALISNKLLLNDVTVLLRASDDSLVIPRDQNLCEGLTLVQAKDAKRIPPSLYPTTNQMSIAHSSWLNIFPFPRVRDNLIRNQKDFNHQELCIDLFGELFSRNAEDVQYQAAFTGVLNISEDDVAARRKGLIVWGEPWDVESWEVTPGFLKKWSWILEGCEDLITASNKWRIQRGEPPLEVVVPSDPIQGGFRDINGIARGEYLFSELH